MLSTTLYVAAQPGIVGQILNDEAVLLIPGKGEVKVLNAVGARIWSLVDGSRTLTQIAAAIAAEYAVEPAQAEADTLAFVAELAQREMVTLAPQPLDAARRAQ
ncbi:MAG TPA: PqqD family protein [Herpetosiphonaceae bacterium]